MSEPTSAAYTPDLSLKGKILRRLTQWRTVKPLRRDPSRPIVTFTFDDFPKSSVEQGAPILEAAGGRGTFYACTGLADADTITGPQFDQTDLKRLVASGHEIGAHTDSHVDCSQAETANVMSDIQENLVRLKGMNHALPVTQFAYPYGETQIDLKNELTDHFAACRGVLSGINGKGSDLMQLRAMELDADPGNTERAINAIEAAADKPAWIIVFTHDVCANPSPFGVTPEDLSRVVQTAKDSGAALLTMSQALAEIQKRAK